MRRNCLRDVLSPLSESSKEAVADATADSTCDIKSYLHITRKIESRLKKLLENAADSDSKQLILVCGNVGDGKSHLLSHLRQQEPTLLTKFEVHNDATESFSPKRSYLDELTTLLEPFSDSNLDNGNDKIILAINLGTLSNFLAATSTDGFSGLSTFIDDNKILHTGVPGSGCFDPTSKIQFVNFCDHHLFHLTGEGPVSNLILDILKKVTASKKNNPIFEAYTKGCDGCVEQCPIRFNFEFLRRREVQEVICQLLVQCIVKTSLLISIRALYNFIHDLLIPIKHECGVQGNILSLSSIIPNYIFEHPEISPVFEKLHELDPIRRSSEELDDLIIRMAICSKPTALFSEYLDMESYGTPLVQAVAGSKDKDRQLVIRTFTRMSSFSDNTLTSSDKPYMDFMKYLYRYYNGDQSAMKGLWAKLKAAIYSWNGNADDGKVNLYTEHRQREYRVSEKLEFSPDFSSLPEQSGEIVERFNTTLPITVKSGGYSGELLIDCRLYNLLDAMGKGYRPCALDKSEFLSFSRFVDRLLEKGSKEKQIFFQEIENGHRYVLALDDFEDFCFRRTEA